MREIEDEGGMDSEVVLRRLYGRALEPETGKELARSLGEWRGLEAADRTFVLAHLARLQLEVLERVLEVVGEGARLCGSGDHVVGSHASDENWEALVTEVVERDPACIGLPAIPDGAAGSVSSTV